MKRDETKKIWGLFALSMLVVISVFHLNLTGAIIYNATLTNISEANITSTSGLAHLNISDANLILYLAMDDNNTLSKVYDYTNNSNDGDLINSPMYISSGLFNGSYNFSGGYDYINVSDSTSLDITGDVTLSAWVNLENSSVSSFIPGAGYSCFIERNSLKCLGRGVNGILGVGSTIDTNLSVAVSGNYNFSSVSLGEAKQTCGILTNGTLLCWGDNFYGQLGNGNSPTDSYVPVPVSGNYNFSSVSLGDSYSCGVLINGSALCWGYNWYGSLGDGTIFVDRNVPVAVSGEHLFNSISAQGGTTCGVRTDGVGMCWGENSYGQVGNGSSGYNILSPVPVSGGHNFSYISAGVRHSCGVLINGTALCWGSNSYGQLGNGTTISRIIPLAVSGNHNFSSISVGFNYFTCGTLTNGTALCWGRNQYGELGDNSITQRTSPVTVSGNYIFSYIFAGYDHSCGLLTSGIPMCWGRNFYGELGDGTTTQRSIPTPVLQGQLFGKGQDTFMVATDFSGEIKSFVEKINVTSNTSLSFGWNHIALSYDDAGNQNLYVNGELAGTATQTGTYSSNNLPLVLMQNTPGLIDEVMVFNKALNSTEITNIYNNQSLRFFSTGEMLFEQNFGSNNRLNITFDNCSTPNSTYIQAKTSSGSYENFSSCAIDDYVISGDNVTIKLISDSNKFYTPLILGNVTFTASYVAAAASESTIEEGSPGGGSSSTTSTFLIPAATSESFWTETTILDDSLFEDAVSEQVLSGDTLTKTEAQDTEKELLDAIAAGQSVTTQEIIFELTEISLGVQERIKLDVKGEEHSVGVANVSEDSVIIHVQSEPQQVLLHIGESAEFNTNNDTLNDLGVTLKSIDENKKTNLNFYLIYHGIVDEEEVEGLEFQQKSKKFFIFLIAILGFLAIIFVFYRFRKFK